MGNEKVCICDRDTLADNMATPGCPVHAPERLRSTSMFQGGRTGHDRERGFYDKFTVTRNDDRKHLHQDCQYFVLDLTHDKFARPAIAMYAEACKTEFPKLADDLIKLLAES